MAIDLANPVIGSTGDFRATPKDQDGAPLADPGNITIVSDNPSVAQVGASAPDADGFSTDATVTVVGTGTANLSATDGTVSSNVVTITVAAATPVLTSIDLEQIG